MLTASPTLEAVNDPKRQSQPNSKGEQARASGLESEDSPQVVGEIDPLEDSVGHPAVDTERLPEPGDAGTATADAARDMAPMANAEARKVVMAALKALDKVTAAAFRLPDTPAAELEEYAAAITPAVASYGHKPGPKFWLGVGLLALAGFVASRLLAAVRAKGAAAAVQEAPAAEETPAGDSSGVLGRRVVEPK